jgi:probable H4MPT-linked C1 transfer pathway protein
MTTIGLDIGGANLKAVFLPESGHEEAWAIEIQFEMWKRSAELSESLQELISHVDPDDQSQKIAVTMTGELADCFSNKKEGVAFIANSLRRIAGKKQVAFYQVSGGWSDFESVQDNWQQIAASNWHAMARFGAQFLPNHTGLIVDVGSTTTDVIPVFNGKPQATGTNDFTRLKNFELIYAGVGRTPICSLIQSVNVEGEKIGLARELFATIGDALIYLGMTPEDPLDKGTADGRSKSKEDVRHRLARMVCSDVAEIEKAVIDRIATESVEACGEYLVQAIAHAIQKSGGRIESVLLVGSGSFFAARVIAKEFPDLSRVSLSQLLTPAANICGPAYAVAVFLKDLKDQI